MEVQGSNFNSCLNADFTQRNLDNIEDDKDIYSFVKKHMLVNAFVAKNYYPIELAEMINQICVNVLLFSKNNIFFHDFKKYDCRYDTNKLITDLQNAKVDNNLISIRLCEVDCGVDTYYSSDMVRKIKELDPTLLAYVGGLGIDHDPSTWSDYLPSISDSGWKMIQPNDFKSLKKLVLGVFSPLSKIICRFQNLISLNLDGRARFIIDDVKKMKNLKLLKLNYENYLDPLNVRQITLITHLRFLELIETFPNANCSIENLKMLRKSLPNIIIIQKK